MSTTLNTQPAAAQVRAVLLAKLKEAQFQHGYVSKEFITETARSLQIPISEVYGVTTFYSFLSTRPLGKYVIRICKSIPCYLKHAEMIIDGVVRAIGIQPGQTTSDGKFSFELTNCIGACDMAPAMLLNQEVHGHLTPEKIAEILSECK
ncbi:MAG: NADH-quinone oxidoreductase subunit NuoE [Desulfobacterales bacterium]|nr:MAG: NADH-quinone oxidoreductase subunit NuoE [Desulfobacterales bacterium]